MFDLKKCGKAMIIFVVLVLLIISLLALYKTDKNQPNNNEQNFTNQSQYKEMTVPISEILKPGDIGEKQVSGDDNNPVAVEESDSDIRQELPISPVVFNTAGTITEINDDRIILNGNGSNFADNMSRILNVIFTSQTTTFISPDQKTRYQGMEGLKHLKVGDKILVEGIENIRGKIEFKAGTINLL